MWNFSESHNIWEHDISLLVTQHSLPTFSPWGISFFPTILISTFTFILRYHPHIKSLSLSTTSVSVDATCPLPLTENQFSKCYLLSPLFPSWSASLSLSSWSVSDGNTCSPPLDGKSTAESLTGDWSHPPNPPSPPTKYLQFFHEEEKIFYASSKILQNGFSWEKKPNFNRTETEILGRIFICYEQQHFIQHLNILLWYLYQLIKLDLICQLQLIR